MSNAHSAFERIEDLIHGGKYAEAQSLMDEVANLRLDDDQYAELMYWWSSWYTHQERDIDAERPIREAINRAHDPGLLSACRRQLAMLLVFLGRYEEALNVCQEALGDNPPEDVLPYLEWWQASAYRLLGRLDEATKSCEACLNAWGERDDESFGAFIALLDIAVQNRDWGAAWTYVHKARAVRDSVGEDYDYLAEWTEQLAGWEEYLREVSPPDQSPH